MAVSSRGSAVLIGLGVLLSLAAVFGIGYAVRDAASPAAAPVGRAEAGGPRPVLPAPTEPVPVPTVTATVTARPTLVVTRSVDALTQARGVKPLWALEDGDRVLYRGELRYWRRFARTVDVSAVSRSPRSRSVQEVRTALLVPVERQRAAP